jgi:hypothetical protein
MLKRRLLVAHELMVTEEHYVKALSVLCRFFYEPLLALSKSDNKEGGMTHNDTPHTTTHNTRRHMMCS